MRERQDRHSQPGMHLIFQKKLIDFLDVGKASSKEKYISFWDGTVRKIVVLEKATFFQQPITPSTTYYRSDSHVRYKRQ